MDLIHVQRAPAAVPRAGLHAPFLQKSHWFHFPPLQLSGVQGWVRVSADGCLCAPRFRSAQEPRSGTMASIPSSGSLMATHNYRRSKGGLGARMGLGVMGEHMGVSASCGGMWLQQRWS